jgi:hypothetical protein
MIVVALKEVRVSWQRWRDWENKHSMETLVLGIAKKSRGLTCGDN